MMTQLAYLPESFKVARLFPQTNNEQIRVSWLVGLFHALFRLQSAGLRFTLRSSQACFRAGRMGPELRQPGEDGI